jgi:site-specific DNA-methyltransferase (adenine-specific)
MTDLATNVLYYGDNVDIVRRYLPDAAVDLVYLDPPFNSNRDYNVIFRDESGNATDAQLLAFEDTWHWGPSAEATYETPFRRKAWVFRIGAKSSYPILVP